MKHLFNWISFLLVTILMTGCGSGDSTETSTTTPSAVTIKTGILIDGPVQGATYNAGNDITGTTDSNGLFNYVEGQKISFYIGDLFIGSALPVEKSAGSVGIGADFMVTPRELTGGDLSDAKTINLTRLLITLDSDQNEDNGIQLDQETVESLEGETTLSFADPFDPKVVLQKVSVATGRSLELPSTADAQNHLCQSLTGSLCTVAPPTLFTDYYGTADNSSWETTSNWEPNSTPALNSEVWMNTADTAVVISAGVTANAWKLSVGRHALNVKMTVDGGIVNIGETGDASSVLLIGQYEDASATLELKSGEINIAGEFAVSVSGKGDFIQQAGKVNVGGRLVIGRYDKTEAIGKVVLNGGSLTADRLEINEHSLLDIRGGSLKLSGDDRNDIDELITAERITSYGSLVIVYDVDDDLTILTATPAPVVFPNFSGNTENPNWGDIANWQPQALPSIRDEAWMNTANSQALIDSGSQGDIQKLSVGRRAQNVSLQVKGTLKVGSAGDTDSLLFVGQYEEASGTLELDGGRIDIAGEFSVAVSGKGDYIQHSGDTTVAGQLNIGRYDKATARGNIVLHKGTLTAENLNINDNSHLELRGGTLYLRGNDTTNVNALLAAGKILSMSDIIVSYDDTTDLTKVTSATAAEDWDVAGIMGMSSADVGPRMPNIVRKGNRQFKPTPPLGTHPRIFFNSSEIPAMRENLAETTVGQEAMKQIRQITVITREGRPVYNLIPLEERSYPNGTSRIDNVGLFDQSATYQELITGQTTLLAALDATKLNVLGSFMALESFEILIDKASISNLEERSSNLAKAMTTWANHVLNDPEFHSPESQPGNVRRDMFGGLHLAYAYDLHYNAMNEVQRTAVRKAIARVLWTPKLYTGIETEGYATTTNWITLNSFVPIMISAIEGETEKARDGWSTQELHSFYKGIMKAHYKFYTYGWYASGAPYEGSGKNYQFNMMMASYAKRGFNFFTHPHVQAYATKFLTAQLQPYGHFITSYDTIGGSGFDPEVGGQLYHTQDLIGVKWAYPDDPSVDFAWRNMLETPYTDGNGDKQVFIDINNQKVNPRSNYVNTLLNLAMMASDFNDGDRTAQNTAALGELTFNGKERGLIVTRSDFTEDAMALRFHVRQDTGGHTFGDRNSFNLSALGRVWVRNPNGYIPETEWSSGLLVNNEGIPITEQDGRKARQPGRIAHYQDNPLATMITGDATYAYSNEWSWPVRDPSNTNVRSGWEAVMESWNDFRHPENQLTEAYGNIPFFDYASWRYGDGAVEGMLKRPANEMNQAYRLAGLVRGDYPYVLVVDDIRKKAGEQHSYQWLAQIPEDLTRMPESQFSGNLNAATDVVLMEPAETGNRRMLIRIINAEGDSSNNLADFKEGITYHLWNQDRVAKRLVIERLAEAPNYRVLLYPYREGDAIPKQIMQENGHIVQEWPGQRDTLVFEPSTRTVGGQEVNITGFRLFRSGETLVDTRNKVVPISVR